MQLIKPSVLNLKSYKPNEIPYRVKLDANEGCNYLFKDGVEIKNIDINYYPDSQSLQLRKELSRFIEVDKENIIAGNGSSEMIELILKTFVDKGETILSFEPSFSMYPIYSQIYSAQYKRVECNDDFSVDMNKLFEIQKEINAKVIFICNPNNPTGYQISKEEIIHFIKKTDALVVVDEAYMEFSNNGQSLKDEVNDYPNLIVLRTLSKAFGLASIRLGYLISNKEIVSMINKVKPPYNLNTLTQQVGIKALREKEKMNEYVKGVKERRKVVFNKLKQLGFKVYESEANFIFFKSDILSLFEKLSNKGILVRRFTGNLEGYYRVSIGTNDENKQFLKALKEIVENERS